MTAELGPKSPPRSGLGISAPGWREVPLREVVLVRPSNVDKKVQVGEVPVSLCNYMDVYSNHIITRALDFMKATASPREIERFRIIPGDVLITKDSETPSDIAVPAVVHERFDGRVLCGYHLALLRPRDGLLVGRFLASALRTPRVNSHFRRNANGSTRYGLTVRAIEEAPVPLPPLPEQRLIAEILDTVDETIRKTEEIIAKLNQIQQGLLNDLLTRGIDENGELRDPECHPEQFKDSPLGRIPREWVVVELSSMADVDRGKFTHRPRNDPIFYGGPFPFIQTGDITAARGGVLAEFSQTLNERGAVVSKCFPAGTIAITIAANIADTAILGLPMYFPDSIVGAVVREPNNTRFVELSIRRAKRRLSARAPQSAQKNINLQDLRPLLMPCPSAQEQARIEEAYEAVQHSLETEVTLADKLSLLKQALMDDLLTGRVRVTVPKEVA